MVRRFVPVRAHTASVDDVTFSPDGRWIVSVGDDAIKAWDRSTGKLLRTFGGESKDPDNNSNRMALSPDGRWIAAASRESPETVTIWNAASGKAEQTIKSHFAVSLAFSPDGRTVATGEHVTKLWDVKSGSFIRAIPEEQPDAGHFVSAAAAPGDRWIMTGPSGLNVWDSASGQPLGDYQNRKKMYFRFEGQVASDGQGRLLVPVLLPSPSSDSKVSPHDIVGIWDATSAEIVQTHKWSETIENPGFLSSVISPDGRLLALKASADKKQPPDIQQSTLKVKLFDAVGGQLLQTLDGPPDGVHEMKFSQDGKLFAAYSHEQILIWDTTSGALLRTIAGAYQLFAFAPNGQWIVIEPAAATGWTQFKIIDLASGQYLRPIKAPRDVYLNKLVVSPDSRSVIMSSFQTTLISVWDTESGERVHMLSGNPGTPYQLAFSADGRKIIAGNDNQTSAVWDAATGELLTSSAQMPSGDWITITPEGFFAASERGAEQVHVVRGFETIRIDQFYQSLYRPDLVREKLAGDPRGLVRDAAANLDLNKVIASGNAPEVRLSLPARALSPTVVDNNASIVAEAEITDRGGGVGRVEWRVNGVTAGVDNPPPPIAGLPLRLRRSLALDAGNNDVAVVAYNSANLIASPAAHVGIGAAPPSAPGPALPNQAATPSPAPTAANARLFVLIAGINDYADQRIKLSYAVSDARDVARGFNEAAGGLYQSVEVKLMTDGEVTRDKLDTAFTEIAGKAQASDVFVLYLAGHGKTVDGRYFFIPQDFKVSGELTEQSIDAAVKATAITQDQLQRWFASVPARKSVILFDTCDSGTLTGDGAETQQLERGAANDRLAQATGRSIITASGGSQEALEGYRGHGLFTYEMLDALNRADSDNSGTIEVTELAAYVYAQVTELSQKVFRQRQAPQMKITSSYPLTKQTRVLQDEVTPVAEAKPYQLSQTAQLQIQPGPGSTVVRSLSAKTAVTVLESKNGWSLIASEGKPLGYVATRDLAPAQ